MLIGLQTESPWALPGHHEDCQNDFIRLFKVFYAILFKEGFQPGGPVPAVDKIESLWWGN
jgi:hypothetical protein